MIIVRIELHSAITGRVTEIGRMVIHNLATGTRERGNYGVRLMRRGTKDITQREGTVEGHARLSAPVWKLVAKALRSVKMV